MQSTTTTIDAYFAEAPAERRAALNRLRVVCSRVFPGAEEGIEYGMPVFKRDGAIVAAFANQKNYISVYGIGHRIVERHRAELKGVDTGKSCIRYRKPDAIDFDLVEAMLIEARDDGPSGGC